MVNVFDLGLKGLREWPNIERAVKLAQPVLDEYAVRKEVVGEVRALFNEIERVKAKLLPIVEAYEAVDQELVPLIEHLSDVFFPHEKRAKPVSLPTPAGGYNVEWLQRSLVELGKAGKFKWLDEYTRKDGKRIKVRMDKFVDGKVGEDTETEVKAFQRRQIDDGAPGWNDEDVDGWAGIKTCARIYNLLLDVAAKK